MKEQAIICDSCGVRITSGDSHKGWKVVKVLDRVSSCVDGGLDLCPRCVPLLAEFFKATKR